MSSPLEKLTRAALELDEAMAALDSKAKSRAGSLMELADGLARELENDLQLSLKQLLDELQAEVERRSRELREQYARMKEEKLGLARVSAETRREEAVRAVLEEIRRLLREV